MNYESIVSGYLARPDASLAVLYVIVPRRKPRLSSVAPWSLFYGLIMKHEPDRRTIVSDRVPFSSLFMGFRDRSFHASQAFSRVWELGERILFGWSIGELHRRIFLNIYLRFSKMLKIVSKLTLLLRHPINSYRISKSWRKIERAWF